MTSYFGMFRVGEITHGDHSIKARDIHIMQNKKKLLIMLRSSKTHCKADKPQYVKFTANNRRPPEACQNGSNFNLCPFSALVEYLRHRKGFISLHEQFFVFKDRSPVLPRHFRKVLKDILAAKGYDSRLYNCHSFRIGRSQDLWKLGVSINTIKKLGRWSGKSNAVYAYLK